MGDALLVPLPVLVPLAAAACAMLLRNSPRGAAWTGLAGAVAATVASAWLLARVLANPAPAFTSFGGWSRPFAISFAAEPLGTGLALASGLVTVATLIHGFASVRARRRRAGFDALALALLAAANGALLTADLFNLYVWFELALLAALGLVGLDRTPGATAGVARYAVLSMLGAGFILTGIALLYGVAGTLDLPTLAAALGGQAPRAATMAAAALLLAGFAMKSGLVPFHPWLAASYHRAPIAVAALLAGLSTKVGLYALLRILVTLFGLGDGGPATTLQPLLAVIAIATMIGCTLAAFAQSDLRRLFAWHVVGQVGYMAMGLAIGTRMGLAAAGFAAVHSMIVQANLMLGAGAIHRAAGSWSLAKVGGMARAAPGFSALMAVPMLSLAGIPPLSGFWAKAQALRAGLDAGATLLVASGLVAGLLAIVSVAGIWSAAMLRPLPAERHHRPIPPAMIGGVALLSAATLVIGLAPQLLWSWAQLSAGVLIAGGQLR